jgi:hypothetical protein
MALTFETIHNSQLDKLNGGHWSIKISVNTVFLEIDIVRIFVEDYLWYNGPLHSCWPRPEINKHFTK